jgi:hypothetical protein
MAGICYNSVLATLTTTSGSDQLYIKIFLDLLLIILIVAVDSLDSASEVPISVHLILVEFRSATALKTVSTDISGEEPSAELLIILNRCPLMMMSNSNMVVGVMIPLLDLGLSLEIVTFHSIKLKFVLHVNDGRLPGHTDTSPEGDSITCDSIITKLSRESNIPLFPSSSYYLSIL